MVTSISHQPADTLALGREWGRSLLPGTVIALLGDLGAGKTQLVKGLAEGLGIQQPVLSPTFALVNVYTEGRLPLFHLDLYRLASPEQIIHAGLEPYFYPDGLTVVEWAERWFGTDPSAHLSGARLSTAAGPPPSTLKLRWVRIEIAGELDRRISYEDFGT